MAMKSVDELGKKWDRCLSDCLIKISAGFGVGVVFSLVLFRRRKWPMIFGPGAGFGMAYANCQHDFNEPFLNKAHAMTKLKDDQSSQSNIQKESSKK